MSPLEIRHAIAAIVELSIRLPRGAPDFGNDVVASFWAKEILADLDLTRVREVCATIAKTAEFFPAPVQFLGAYEGVGTNDAEIGNDVAAKIEQALGRIGAWWEPYQPPHDQLEILQRVREMVGELGWEFIQARGGWWAFCNAQLEESLQFARTEWAKTLTAMYKQRRAFGPNPAPIGIPGARREQERLGAGTAAKYLHAAALEAQADYVPPPPKVDAAKFRSAFAKFREETGA